MKSSNWPVGTAATMFDCYGVNPATGRVVAHPGPFSVTIRAGADLITGGTSLLAKPSEVTA